MNDFQSGTTTALSSQRYFPNMRANRQNKYGLKLFILEQSVISATEKAQGGVNDEHTRACTKPNLKNTYTRHKYTYHTYLKESHFLKFAVWGSFDGFFCVNLHSCGLTALLRKVCRLCGEMEMRH